jgi:hypothetical protein
MSKTILIRICTGWLLIGHCRQPIQQKAMSVVLPFLSLKQPSEYAANRLLVYLLADIFICHTSVCGHIISAKLSSSLLILTSKSVCVCVCVCVRDFVFIIIIIIYFKAATSARVWTGHTHFYFRPARKLPQLFRTRLTQTRVHKR